MNWISLKEEVISICDKEELERVKQEFKLFEQRKWENYILFSIRLLSRIDEFLGGSIRDSYVVRKYLKKSKDESWLRHQNSKEILFNDALRLNIEIIRVVSHFEKEFLKVNDLFESTINEFNFYRKETLTKSNSEILILSDKKISNELLNVILNEKKNSTDEEIELLRSVLIINITLKPSKI